MTATPFPRLDLAPKLNRPLRLWWPPDYLRLLCWAFFFPQAIRWYVETFGKPEYQKANGREAVWQALRHDPIQRRLAIQAFLVLTLITPGIAWLSQVVGISVDWEGVTFGVTASVVVGLVTGLWRAEAGDMAFDVAFGTTFGVMVGVAFGIWSVSMGGMADVALVGMTFGVAFGVMAGMTFGILINLMSSVAGGVGGGVAFRVVRIAGLSMISVVVLSGTATMALSIANILRGGDATRAVLFYVVAFVVIVVVTSTIGGRLLDWLLMGFTARLVGRMGGGRLTWLPLPGVKRELAERLTQSWAGGVQDVNQVLSYTLQFIPAVQAINAVLAASSQNDLLARAAVLADYPFDWRLVLYGSADLTNRLSQEAIGGAFFWIPGSWRRRWQTRFPIDPQLDTPARAACAGFWYWHRGEVGKAADTFAVVSDLRHGPELHGIARAIVSAQRAGDLDAIMAFGLDSAWLAALPDPELRPGTLEALRTLRQIAAEARVARYSVSALSRSAALGRANAALTQLIETGGETCPEPEWPLIQKIAEKWRDIISEAGGVVGEEVLRQPVPNPYEGYSGLPVTSPTFIGRENILQHIEDLWAGGAQPPPLILYGHRRMGKSSILRNLNHVAGANSIVVYLDMQDAGWVDHTGQLLLDFAEAIHRRAREGGLDAGQPPAEANYADLGTARRSLNALLDRLNGQMAGRRLILAIDEYEIIEAGIEEGHIDSDLPGYLRAKASQYRWLALVFAGRHTLEEMGHDYRNAFGAAAAEHIRVGYLSHDDAIRLITQPQHPDFALEYSPKLREKLYRLTYGQPYLLQRLCWELVNRWNERFLRGGESTPRILTLADLAPVLTPDFYQAAGYYFDGVWTNVTESERQLMRVLAGRTEGIWKPAELAAAAGLPEDVVRASLDLLRRHDVILDEVGGVRFAAELMRRWVAEHGGAP